MGKKIFRMFFMVVFAGLLFTPEKLLAATHSSRELPLAKPKVFALEMAPLSLAVFRLEATPSWLVSKTLEVPFRLEVTYRDKIDLFGLCEIQHKLLSLSSGMKFLFNENGGDSFYVEPLLGYGYLEDFGQGYHMFTGFSSLGYMWQWSHFRLSFELGGKYEYIVNGPKNDHSMLSVMKKRVLGVTHHYEGGFWSNFGLKIGWAV